MRVYAYTSTAPYTYACMYVCMLVLYERTIVDSISWPCVLLIRNNVCILFTAYIFFICFRFFFSPMFRHFLVMVNCAGYISLYTIHNIHIICIRYNTCIIYSESIYIYISVRTSNSSLGSPSWHSSFNTDDKLQLRVHVLYICTIAYMTEHVKW